MCAPATNWMFAAARIMHCDEDPWPSVDSWRHERHVAFGVTPDPTYRQSHGLNIVQLFVVCPKCCIGGCSLTLLGHRTLLQPFRRDYVYTQLSVCCGRTLVKHLSRDSAHIRRPATKGRVVVAKKALHVGAKKTEPAKVYSSSTGLVHV